MFGLGWFTMVEVWGGLGNIYFSCMNGLVWIQVGSQPISRANAGRGGAHHAAGWGQLPHLLPARNP